MKTRPKLKYNLLVTAHPDDESLFFSGLVLSKAKLPWTLICATDGNADGAGQKRQADLKAACKKLKIKKLISWGLQDIYENRLDVEWMQKKLSELPPPQSVWTHSPLGEYGHPHHQDISIAVHRTFKKVCPIFSTAYNCYPKLSFKLSEKIFKIKTQLLSETYFSETRRLIDFLPATHHESFTEVSLAECEAIYQHLIGQKAIEKKQLKVFRWFWPYLEARFKAPNQRPF